MWSVQIIGGNDPKSFSFSRKPTAAELRLLASNYGGDSATCRYDGERAYTSDDAVLARIAKSAKAAA